MESGISFFVRTTLTVLLLLVAFNLFAQRTSRRQNLNRSAAAGVRRDTARRDSSRRDTAGMDSASIKTATGLSSEIKYTAEDSIKFSIDGKIIYLYGKGRIYYEDLELDADYVRIDQKNKLLFASGVYDKYKVYRGRPIFKQGSDAPVTTDSLLFNFETKKGKAFGTATSVDEGYIQARQFKKNEYNEGFLKNGIYSTCNLPEPYTHFGIHIDRGIITEKQIIAKSAYLEIEHIPMPIWLPFGFFPKTNKRASGFRFPTFGEDASRGFYMQGIGWYFGINDYWDADVTGTLYSKGSYDINTIARYKKNYKYSGSLNLSFASIKDPNAIEGTPGNKASKQFNIQWTHSQDQAAHPGTTFSASVNFGTSSYFQQTAANGTYNYASLTRNNMSSSISYATTFLDGLFSFSSALRHSQDLTTKHVDLLLPQFNLGLARQLNPFDSKNRVGEQKWYQKITVNYSLSGENSFSGQEDEVFKKESLKKYTNTFRHAIPVSMSLNVLKVLQFNTSVNYNELWTFQTLRKSYDPSVSGMIRTDTVQGFARNYNYAVSGGFSTKLYGIYKFKKGNIMAIRHVVTPNVSFSYSPDFTSSRFGFYRDISGLPEVGTTLGDSLRSSIGNSRYSIFKEGSGGTRQASINFSLDNTIEAKRKTKSDTSSATENVPIIQGLSFSGSYNFVADSLKLSQIGFSGRTAFFKQKIGLNFSGSFDPYEVIADKYGNPLRVNRFLVSRGKLARLTSFSLSTDFNFNSSAQKKRNDQLRAKQDDPNLTPSQQEDVKSILDNPDYYVDFNVPWNVSAGLSFNYSNTGLKSTVNSTINVSGDFSLTPKWKVQFHSGYDFKQKEITLPDFSINRDLHCWDMAVHWIPIGPYKSYSIDIRVRASILQDLKISRRSSLPYF